MLCGNCPHAVAVHDQAGCLVDGCPCQYDYTRNPHTKGKPVATDRCTAEADESSLYRAGLRCELRIEPAHKWHQADDYFWIDNPSTPADTQVGGSHYRDMPIQPWQIIDAFGLDFYSGSALKYLLRAGRKGSRLEDWKKCRHYLDKMIELEGESE